MSGPTLVIDLAEPLSPAQLREFRALMVGLSSRFAEKRPGFFDVNVPAERLGVEDRREEDWRKPFPLPLLVPRQATFAPSRRPARPLAAPAENPSTSSTRAFGRHTESTHRTPLLDGQTLPDAALGNASADEELTALVGFGPQREDRDRPFLVYLMGPGVGDESIFEAEHEDEPEAEALLGFRPTHAVNVSACCNREIDHVATALLTAAVMDVIGGVAKAELPDGQESVVAGLPGVLGFADWMALGTAEFLRAWVGHPAFRLVK
ncbi:MULTISPECIES: DUF6368 family protein [Streptomyces]|uniref:DUF6368 family protein n=1 Tax=Streptomyces TaxID=1883 RepID=UPI0005EDCDBA|nr:MULTISPECIES: DUF6368 family protein [unclassified Streptomyces]UJV40297.1 hypothetical protein CVT30_10915 [Streptomyces sp. AMCC400023]